ASIAMPRKMVWRLQGVQPEQLRCGNINLSLSFSCLRSLALSLQGCDLLEQNTMHSDLALITRLDLTTSSLPTSSTGLGVILETDTKQRARVEPENTGRGECVPFTFGCFFQWLRLQLHLNPPAGVHCVLKLSPSLFLYPSLPERSHGVCQSEGCLDRVAELYLKCAAHDTSVALDLFMPIVRDVPCIACTNIIGDLFSSVLLSPCCCHLVSLDLFHIYCVTRLNDRQFIHQSDGGYSHPCAGKLLCLNRISLTPHHYRGYQRYAAEECLLQMGGVLCPDGRSDVSRWEECCVQPSEDDRRMIQCLISNGLGCRERHTHAQAHNT
uniref:Parkin RBR E3 ubiquitin protein ligase n=1 Tax=Oncorhynchus tshawytscha TaxID=74940 RepID=A0A8C8IDJ4_ONCTS